MSALIAIAGQTNRHGLRRQPGFAPVPTCRVGAVTSTCLDHWVNATSNLPRIRPRGPLSTGFPYTARKAGSICSANPVSSALFLP